MNIDVHAHLYPKPFLKYLDKHDIDFGLPGLPFAVFPKLYEVNERFEDMERARLDHQVLSLGCPGVDAGGASESVDLAKAFNDSIAEIVRTWPERFSAFAAVPMQDPDSAVLELTRAVEELGFPGGHTFTNVKGEFLDSERFWPVYEAAEDLGVPLFVHPTTPVCLVGAEDWGLMISVAFLQETTMTASRLVLGGVLERFAQIDFILCHLGAALPYILPRVDIETELNSHFIEDYAPSIDRPPSDYYLRFYIDTVSHHAAAYRCAIETWGIDRIVLGSDYPYSRWERTMDAIEELGLTDEEEAKICRENAARLLGIEIETRHG